MTQIATTLEQSKRLLAAGLDPKSCDMRWTNEVEVDDGWGFIITEEEEEYHLELGQPFFVYPSDPSIPAWSLARLWDAFGLDIHGGWFSVGSSTSEDVIEELVRMVEQRHANDGTISNLSGTDPRYPTTSWGRP